VPRARFSLCDVFATRPLSGNQLAVVETLEGADDDDMAALAREFGFSETTFTGPAGPAGTVPLRIFTPSVEIPFAGHPILGSAVVVGRATGRPAVQLGCGVGTIDVALAWHDGARATAWMTQPVPSVVPHPEPEALLAALGVGRSRLPVTVYDNGMAHAYVALDDPDTVAALRPDLRALEALGTRLGAFCGVNCFGGEGRRWRNRMFAPAVGVQEDPATGSAAGPLACHLARHGWTRWGEQVEISQGSEIGRPSALSAVARGSADAIESVRVGGEVHVLGKGEISW
jgi:trans-2,3-dihydro-3-hydroxyanthranilate isomerase